MAEPRIRMGRTGQRKAAAPRLGPKRMRARTPKLYEYRGPGNPEPRKATQRSRAGGNPFTFPGNPGSLVIASGERIRNALKNKR